MLFAIGLFIYAGPGLVVGTVWLIIAITKGGQPGYTGPEFIIGSTINLVLAPLALIGGILSIRYANAAGRAYVKRSSEALERAIRRQLHIWRWALATLLALCAIPVILFGIAAIMGVWP
jgi:hypothetical protein